ncbi:MAG TPA: alanine--tRNA ligase [Acidimicrobiales bacterium]
MDADALRRAFTQFFVDRGHTPVPSAGLIPHHPRAPLFTNAGMNQFIPYFLGEERPPFPRATSIQKCVRIRGKHDDIDLIGRTTRHLTFFEMLGNFSFGDYFKEKAIPLAWELLTGPLGMDGDRLWVTVYRDDDDAAAIWSDQVGVPAARIQRLADDNFWEMGETGPCGPSSEIYYDRGPHWGPGGGPGGGGAEERFVEIWNLVFMQYDRHPDGTLEPLPKPNIDTGAGLERVLMVLQDVPSIWETDVLRPIIARAEALTGRAYGEDAEVDVALRILADHARSLSFLIGDGVFPSNEDRGYVLRRLIRRAVRQAYLLGVERPVTPSLVGAAVELMGEAYPDLARQEEYVIGVAAREEGSFRATLRSGLTMLESELSGGATTVSGPVAFRLHDTHGFPIELTREIAAERGATVDEAGFDAAMRQQRHQSKQSGKGPDDQAVDRHERYRQLLDEWGTTKFVGYTDSTATATVLAVIDADLPAEQPTEPRVEIFLDVTPFYAEGGGQVGDTGTIETETGRARVLDTTAALPGLTRHLAVVEEGDIRPGQVATAAIDTERRAAIRRNHTATHLLHWALRQVLGDHVKQQGSLVAPDRLRFDFTHYGPLTADEIARIEDLANAQVLSDGEVQVTSMQKRDADAAGAIAFFEDKYGDQVRVVQAGPESLELCGGTHVARLGQIGPIEIVSEGSIGSNLRRIEATTGTATLARLRQAERQIADTAALLRARPDELTTAVERKLADVRELENRLKAAEHAALAGQARTLVTAAIDGWLVARADGLETDQLRQLANQARQVGGLHTVVLGGSPDGSKAVLVALAAKDSQHPAPALISDAARTVGGGGGGKNSEQAVAGGKDASRLDEALDQIRDRLRQ